jgi:hypothetical protein
VPIAVKCPACSAKMNAPAAAAGKRVKCPKCAAVVVVPEPEAGFEVVDEESPRPPKVPVVKKAASGDDEDDDDEDEGDDAPVRPKSRRPAAREDDRPRKKNRAGKKVAWWPFILGGGVLLVFGLLGLAYMMMTPSNEDNKKGGSGSGPATTQGTGPAVPPRPAPKLPAGWDRFNDPLGEVELYVPGGQLDKNAALSEKLAADTGGAADLWTRVSGEKTYMLQRTTVSPAALKKNSPQQILAIAASVVRDTYPRARQKNLSTYDDNGRHSVVVTIDLPVEKKRLIVRILISGDRLMEAHVLGPAVMTATDADVTAFIDNFRSVK